MVEVEGYKMFRGVMRINSKSKDVNAFELVGDFLYKPEYGCWYHNGHSYCDGICEVVNDFYKLTEIADEF